MLMTHDLQRDIALLVAMADDPPGWIGLLGPAARRDRVLDAVVARGVQVDGLRRVLHGPAGLDLGAEGAREIALSIIAQILATSRGRTGQPLSCRTGP
jgi:xanthine dehydrogenase accessory factor